LRCVTHTSPPIRSDKSSNPIPPAGPLTGAPGTNPVPVAPWQNVWIPKATSIGLPVNTMELGITVQVIVGDEGVHPSCTVPVTPGALVICSP
jgi:hypothetical protein